MNMIVIRPLLYAVCLIAVFGSTLPGSSQTDPLAQAFIARNAEFTEIRALLATAETALGELERDVSTVAASLASRADLTSAEAMEVTDHLYGASLQLQRHAALRTVRAFADKLDRASDAAHELASLKAVLQDSDVGGTLRHLHATIKRLGPDEAALGARAEAYAGVISRLVEAIDTLAARLDTMRAQARLGSDAYGGANDPRYRQLAVQWGQQFADAAPYLPSSPWEVFLPIARSGAAAPDVVLIWDEPEQTWYRADGNVPVEAIFRDAYVALDRRPTPGRLKYLAENFAQVKQQQAAAEAIASYLAEASRDAGRPENRGFTRLAESGKMVASLQDPATLRVKFVYDATFRAWLLRTVDALRQDLVAQGPAAEPALRDLDALARRHGVTLESQWAQGVLPENGSIRVVAWFSDNPKNKFSSIWQFEREKVTIEVDKADARSNGHAQGLRTGNVVRTERSIPGRNCIASDERVFQKDGTLTFSSVYVCTSEKGATEINNVTGAGTWQVMPSPIQAPKKTAR